MKKFFNLSTREGYGEFASFVGIGTNLLLSVVKLTIGLLSGAISIVADAFNNISDMGTSVIMLAGFKIAAKPADPEHPFGYGRAEYLAGLFIAVAMLFVGGHLLQTSVKKFFEPDSLNFDTVTLIALGLSVAAKFLLGIFYRHAARKIDSSALKAAALDSFTDCLATGVVIFSVVVWLNSGWNIDGGAGIFVSIFILRGGLSALKEILNPLLGEAPDQEFIDAMKKIVTDAPEVIDVHDIIVHSYGAKRSFVSMHVEMPATMELLAAHEVIDRLERKLHSRFEVSATLHVDPVIVDDKNFDALKNLATEILSTIGEKLSLHDFRVVPYKAGNKLIFEVSVPQDFPLSDREIRREFQRRLIEKNPADRAIIHFDHEYC